jgi:hypothetical protein
MTYNPCRCLTCNYFQPCSDTLYKYRCNNSEISKQDCSRQCVEVDGPCKLAIVGCLGQSEHERAFHDAILKKLKRLINRD